MVDQSLRRGSAPEVIGRARRRPAPPIRYDPPRAKLATKLRTKQDPSLPSVPTTSMGQLEVETWRNRLEVSLALADHQPVSMILTSGLGKLPPRTHADYCAAKVSYAGCSRSTDNVTPLDEFIAELS